MRPIRVAGRSLGRFRLRGGQEAVRGAREQRDARDGASCQRLPAGLVSACRQVLSALAGRPRRHGQFCRIRARPLRRITVRSPRQLPEHVWSFGSHGDSGAPESTGTKIADSAQYTQAMSRTHSTAGGGGGRRAADPGQEAQDVHPAPAWSTTIPIPRDLDGSMARLRVCGRGVRIPRCYGFPPRSESAVSSSDLGAASWRVAPVRTQHDLQPCCARAGSPGAALGWPNVCIGKSAYSMVDLS